MMTNPDNTVADLTAYARSLGMMEMMTGSGAV